MSDERSGPPDTIDRDALYAAIWEAPARTVASRYAITSTALAKICKKLRVSTPPRGYWARKAAGHKVVKTPLPRLAAGQQTTYVVTSAQAGSQPMTVAEPIVITVPEVVSDLHPLVKRCEGRLRRGEKNPWHHHACIAIRVSPPQIDRALRVMHGLVCAFEERGCTVEVTPPTTTAAGGITGSETFVTVAGVRLRLMLTEDTRREPVPPLTDDEIYRAIWKFKDMGSRACVEALASLGGLPIREVDPDVVVEVGETTPAHEFVVHADVIDQRPLPVLHDPAPARILATFWLPRGDFGARKARVPEAGLAT